MKKVLKISAISFGVIILFLLIAPFLFKGKIVEVIKKSANTHLRATLNFDNNIGLNFFRNFPNASVSIDNLSILGKDSFLGDTLINFPKLRFTVDILSLFSGNEIKIKKLFLSNPTVNIEYLPSGLPNWDIYISDTLASKTKEPSKSGLKLGLKLVEIENGNLIYNDRSRGIYLNLRDFEHHSSGDFSLDNFLLETQTKAKAFTFGHGGINWISNVGTEVLADIQMDLHAMKFSFSKGKVNLNEIHLESDGFVDLNENDIDMDIQFKALENTFKSFLSLVPGMYQNNFKDLQASGSMGFKGFIKGKMTDVKLPQSDVSLEIKDGNFKYPGLQFPASNIFLNLHFVNPDGVPDNSVLDVKNLNLNIAGDPFALKLLLKTPSSDPFIDGVAKGKLDFSKIAGLIPLEKGTEIAGLLNADISAKGNYSAASNKNFERLQAAGRLLVQNFHFKSGASGNGYDLKNLNLEFTPQNVKVNECSGNFGKNDFNVNGYVNNFLGYAFANETLKGEINLESNYINVNSFMSDKPVPAEPTVADTGKMGIVEVPANLDIALNTKIQKLIYDNYILTNFGGHTHVHNSQLDLENMHADLLGGNIQLNGIYDSKNVKNPFTNMDTHIERINLGQTFDYFPMLARFAPIAKYVDGLIHAKIDMSSILNEKMQPNYNSMNVNGEVTFSNAIVKNLDIVKQIASQLKIGWLQNLQLKNQTVKFNIKEGIFKLLDSLVLPIGNGATMKLAGMTKLDKTLNYGGWIKIPRTALGEGNTVLNKWISQASAKGINLKVAEIIPVDLSVSGNILKPIVSLGLKGFKETIVDNLKEQGKEIAKGEARKKISEGLKIATNQADKIKAEAKIQADRIRAEGKSAAETFRNEAKKRSNQLRDEGDKTYARIIAETNQQCDKVIESATNPIEKQGKKIIAERLRKEGAKKAEDAKVAIYKQADAIDNEAAKRADQTEAEANKRADEIENNANLKADKIIKEAEEKSKI